MAVAGSGRRSRREPLDCPITRCSASDRRWCRRVRRSTFTEGAIMERAEYNRHSRARMAETAKDGSRHPAPDAPERVDHRRRCTRHDHRTCCGGSRGSASLPCHRCENASKCAISIFASHQTTLATSHQPPATSHQPPATSHQPPATSHQPLATRRPIPRSRHRRLPSLVQFGTSRFGHTWLKSVELPRQCCNLIQV